ncbi:MAG: hypothetical protein Q9170_000091 [Blastenia crenularia]
MAQFSTNARAAVLEQFQFPKSRSMLSVINQDRRMTNGMIIWFFWDLGRQLAQRYPMPHPVPRFWGSITTGAEDVGNFLINLPRSEVASSNDSTNGLISASRRDLIVKPTLRVGRGTKTCHEDPDLVIRYEFLGRQITPAQVLTAFLSGNTFFSEHEEQGRGVSMAAWSSDRSTHLALDGGDREPAADQLTWSLARIGMRTVWREVVMGYNIERLDFVDGPRWETVTFTYEYKGVRIGRGWLG